MIQELYLTHEGNCSALCRTISTVYAVKISLRMLQRFCKPFRQVLREAQVTEERSGRFETDPGDQLQIDFGEKYVTINDKYDKVYFYVGILGYSRRIFVKAFTNHATSSWLDGIESNLHYLGGKPDTIVSDNEASLVNSHARGEENKYTTAYQSFCDYYGIRPRRTAVRKPRSKGKVERAVQYVKDNALVGMKFKDLNALNRWLEEWSLLSDERELARMPEGLKTPKERFRIEQLKLGSVTKPRIARIRCETRKVTRNGLIRIDNADYLLPAEFANKEVQVFIAGDDMEVYLAGQSTFKLDKVKSVYTPVHQVQAPVVLQSVPQSHTELNTVVLNARTNPVGRSIKKYDAVITAMSSS
jgi:hypothetical protein